MQQHSFKQVHIVGKTMSIYMYCICSELQHPLTYQENSDSRLARVFTTSFGEEQTVEENVPLYFYSTRTT